MSNEGKKNMMGMMSKLMQGDKPDMMDMMPKCLGMMVQNMQKNDRIAFTLKMVSVLVEQSCMLMSDDERKDFSAKVVEQIKT